MLTDTDVRMKDEVYRVVSPQIWPAASVIKFSRIQGILGWCSQKGIRR
jgi:hypothetical protein